MFKWLLRGTRFNPIDTGITVLSFGDTSIYRHGDLCIVEAISKYARFSKLDHYYQSEFVLVRVHPLIWNDIQQAIPESRSKSRYVIDFYNYVIEPDYSVFVVEKQQVKDQFQEVEKQAELLQQRKDKLNLLAQQLVQSETKECFDSIRINSISKIVDSNKLKINATVKDMYSIHQVDLEI